MLIVRGIDPAQEVCLEDHAAGPIACAIDPASPAEPVERARLGQRRRLPLAGRHLMRACSISARTTARCSVSQGLAESASTLSWPQ